MGRKVAVVNQKGGVAKSTSAVNLAAEFAGRGYRTILIDMDPQGNASQGLGIAHEDLVEEQTIYEALINPEADIDGILTETDLDNLLILPSNINLSGAELEMASHMMREFKLRTALGRLKEPYDLLICDCPPSLGLLTVNAMACCDELWIPVDASIYGMTGIGQLMNTYSVIRSNGLNPDLQIGAVFLTLVDAREAISDQAHESLVTYFEGAVGDVVARTRIPRNTKLKYAPSEGKPIQLYAPDSPGAKAYSDLAEEILSKRTLAKGA